MKRKFKFDAKMVKKSLLWCLLIAIIVSFVAIVVQSYNPNHTFSKSGAPEVLIPSGNYEDFLKIESNIPEDALDQYPLDFNKLVFPNTEDIIVPGISGVPSANAVGFGQVEVTNSQGEKVTAYKTTDDGYVTYTIPNVPAKGLYNIYVNYFTDDQGGAANIERRILINQDLDKEFVTQYSNLDNVKFQRYFKDKGPIVQDTTDNDMKPSQVEISNVQRKAYLRDLTGYIIDPYLIRLEKGTNTITFESIRESMLIVSVGVSSYKSKISYTEYQEQHKDAKLVNLSAPIKIEGESSEERNSPTLYAIPDRTDPMNYPVDPVKTKLNSIGGIKWITPGDAITWKIDLTNQESGLYYISFRAKQNVARGLFSTRRVYINGEIPFIEANTAKFSYSSDYRIVTLGNETEPFAFYLEGGKVNTISLEATLGDYGTPISEVQKAIDMLNNLYLRIIAVTTVNPDPYQDYHLYGENAKVVGTIETFEEAANILEKVSKEITALSGEKSDKEAILDTMVYQLRNMINKPRTIQERLTDFSKNLSSLGTWINSVKEQPLAIEAIYVHSSLDQLPNANSNFFKKTWFGIVGFIKSFWFDYESIGTIKTVNTGKEIEVWFLTSAAAGREQANAVSALISNSFINEYGINVKLKVVAPGVLLPSTVAGTGPDIAINVDNGLPVNYAMRNAVKDISVFDDFYEVTGICSAANAEKNLCSPEVDYNQGRINSEESDYLFFDSSMVPYEFDGGYYALPNTASFLVMFYRTDIFEERGWSVPETWREVTSLVTELSISNLQFYLPVSTAGASAVNPIFATMLYQKGGSFYRNNNKESNFDTEEAMQAFEEWSKYYTDYSFPLAASFLNRFRTGETPIGISGYELFNTITVFAPEIAGKWKFAPLPGTYTDGVYNNSGSAGGSAIAMMKDAKDPESAWNFMKWWVSKNTQRDYAFELESILGAAARHNTANVLAFQDLSWTKEEQNVLINQWKNSVGVPEVPGGYYTGRNIENAFREVVNSDTNPRETLQEYIILINAEIKKKRAEFGLEE